MSKESVQVRKDASACLTARKVFSAEGSRLTFRKSRKSGIHEQKLMHKYHTQFVEYGTLNA